MGHRNLRSWLNPKQTHQAVGPEKRFFSAAKEDRPGKQAVFRGDGSDL